MKKWYIYKNEDLNNESPEIVEYDATYNHDQVYHDLIENHGYPVTISVYEN